MGLFDSGLPQWNRPAVVPRLWSVLIHVTLASVALMPQAKALKPLQKGITEVVLYTPQRPIFAPSKDPGGGGGGRLEQRPQSKGRLPRIADKQLAPPDPHPAIHPDPTLIVEPSIVAPEVIVLPRLNLLNIGDPDGIPGPPSSGPGDRNGIGAGNDHGIGDRNGPGFGPEDNGGIDGPLIIGGGVSNPVLVTQIIPEYSEDARKARYEGTVVVDTIVREDGSVDIVRVARGLGFGLDEKAIAAILQWKFRPARKNGRPVAVLLKVEVNFNLR